MKLYRVKLLIVVVYLFSNCSRVKEIPDENFIGLWELKGRSMFEGIQIRINKEDGRLIGRISKLNENKYIRLLANEDDLWISQIERSSNFEFKLTEKKVASELFSIYALPTSQDFNVEFIDDNTFGLGTGNSDPLMSKIVYKRMK